MLIENIRKVIDETWPTIVIAAIIFISIRLAWLYHNRKVIVYHKEIMGLLFLVYALLLFQTVTFQDVSWSTSNFEPFKEIFRYDVGDPLFYKNVVGNCLIFAPYGFFVSYYLRSRRFYITLLVSLIASVSIEYTQLVIGRVFDIDDIILNMIGALIGYYVYRLLLLFVNIIPNILKKRGTFNIIKIVLIALALFIIYIGITNWWC